MRWTTAELRWRDALLAAMIPAPDSVLGFADVDLATFWARFDAAAPLHLRLGLRAANAVLVAGLPRVLGYGASLAQLGEAERDRVLDRARGIPIIDQLVELAKVVACLAYFSDPGVEAAARRRS